MIIRKKSYPRAGLIGNPSDGYFGKTISFIIRNFSVEVTLWESPELVILPAARDKRVFDSLDELSRDVRTFGYYGGLRLLKATVKRFLDHCREEGITLPKRNFTLRYKSNVPSHVGMAGSSAIITAALRALMEFYEVQIEIERQPNLILAVENEELKIPAGLQDRVIQAYEGVVFMDFNKNLMESRGFGEYEEIDPDLLPPLYVAYNTRLSEGTEVFHSDLRARYDHGDPDVHDAIARWAELAQQCRDLLVGGRGNEIGSILDENFNLRQNLYQISEGNTRMVELARAAGATAKFTGSGGAIVGTYEGEAMFQDLVESLKPLDLEVIKPQILPEEEEGAVSE